MKTKKIITAFFIFGSLGLSANVFMKKPKDLFKENKCRKEVSDQLYKWKSVGNWTKHITGENSVKLMSPTRDYAKWIEIHFDNGKNYMSLITPGKMITVRFDAKCARAVNIVNESNKLKSKGLTDEKLYKIMKSKKNGLVYSWGPQMPLSLDGIREIRKAAKKAKLPLILVMPSERSLKLAKSQLKKKKIKVDEFVVSNSMELAFRGAFLHLPSVIMFKDSKLERRARPGYEVSRLYSEYISSRLGE